MTLTITGGNSPTTNEAAKVTNNNSKEPPVAKTPKLPSNSGVSFDDWSKSLPNYRQYIQIGPCMTPISNGIDSSVVTTNAVDEAKDGKENTTKALSDGIEGIKDKGTIGDNVKGFVEGKVASFSVGGREEWKAWSDEFLVALARDAGKSEEAAKEDVKKLSAEEKDRLIKTLQSKTYTDAAWYDGLFGPDTLVSLVKKVGQEKFDNSVFKKSEWEAISNYYAPEQIKSDDVRRMYAKTTMEIGSDVKLSALEELVKTLNKTTPPKFAIINGILIAYGELTEEEAEAFKAIFRGTTSEGAFNDFLEKAKTNSQRPVAPNTDIFDGNNDVHAANASVQLDKYALPQEIVEAMLSKVSPTLKAEGREKIYRTGIANRVGQLQNIVGRPLSITSGYRDEAYNKRVGGAKFSQHMNGAAADILIPAGMTFSQFRDIIEKSGLFDGIGLYPESGFIHVDVRGSRARW